MNINTKYTVKITPEKTDENINKLDLNESFTRFVDKNYNPIGCRHTPEFKESLFNPVATKSGGACVGFIAEKRQNEVTPFTGNPKKHWIAKIDSAEIDPASVSRLHSVANRSYKIAAWKEYMASVLYSYLSHNYKVPKTKLTELTWVNEYTKNNELLPFLIAQINQERPSDQKLTKGVHILSKMIEEYRDLKVSKVNHKGLELDFMIYVIKYNTVPEKIIVDGEELPLLGLMEILAVAKLMHDIDVLGYGTNIGFIIKESCNGKIARAVKIDPGCSFYTGDSNMFISKALKDPCDIQINTHQHSIYWNNLTLKQKREFLLQLTISSLELNKTELIEYLCWRNGLFEQKSGKSITLENVRNILGELQTNCDRQMEIYYGSYDTCGFIKHELPDGTYISFNKLEKNIRNGYGLMCYTSGTMYLGKWKNDKRHDEQGLIIYATGTKYKEKWMNDIIYGIEEDNYSDYKNLLALKSHIESENIIPGSLLVKEYGKLQDKNKQWFIEYCNEAINIRNNVTAKIFLGYIYQEVIKDFDKCLQLYTAAAKNDNSTVAMLSLGYLYQNEPSIQNIHKSIEWYKKAADTGVVEAMFNLGTIYQHEERNINNSILYFERAAKAGDFDAMYCLGVIYWNESDVKSIEKAIYWYELSANKNNSNAMYELGLIYNSGESIKDLDKAIKYCVRASQVGNTKAMYYLGTIYKAKNDIEKAIKYYEQAIEAGHTDAIYELGLIYEQNIKKIDKAIELYENAAKKGNSNAMYRLGIVYEHKTVPIIDGSLSLSTLDFSTNTIHNIEEYEHNLNEADRWYEAAAQAGHREAIKIMDSRKNKEKLSNDKNNCTNM